MGITPCRGPYLYNTAIHSLQLGCCILIIMSIILDPVESRFMVRLFQTIYRSCWILLDPDEVVDCKTLLDQEKDVDPYSQTGHLNAAGSSKVIQWSHWINPNNSLYMM